MEEETFTYEEEVAMIEELCVELDCSFEMLAERALHSRHEHEFTLEQQTLVMDNMCQEFGFSCERANNNRGRYDTVISKESAPGENDIDDFICGWGGLFGGRPVCSNIGSVVNHFKCEYNNSNAQKFCKELLIGNQKEYYKTLI